MRQNVLVAFLLMVVCLAGIAAAAPVERVQPPQDLALLKAAIFQAPTAQTEPPAAEEGLIGKLSPKWKRAEDCSNYTLPCAIYQCNCRNRCAPCGGVQTALCFNVCDCVNPGC